MCLCACGRPSSSSVARMDCQRLAAYRFVAYSSVTFSVVAVLSICITLPMVFNYVNHVKRSVNHEIDFCKVGLPAGILLFFLHGDGCRKPGRFRIR